MAIGVLLDKLKGKERSEPKRFLALLLTEEVVQAAVWQVVAGVTDVVALGSPVEWDGEVGTSSELVTAVDGTIASATEGVEGEINEVILGVPYSWTDKAGIIGSKRELVKKINQELELKPLGYVTLTDSVLTYLKMQEGSPTTSVVIEIARRELTVVLVKLGRIENIVVVPSTGKVENEVVDALQSIGSKDNLPSRMILFNNMHNLDEIAQNLLQIPWQKNFEFLHLPKIETLPKDVAIRSVAVAGGSEVAKTLGFPVEEKSEDSGQMLDDSEDKEKAEREELTLLTEAEIGFGLNERAEEKSEERESEEESPTKKEWKLPQVTWPKWQFPKWQWPKIRGGKLYWILGGIGLGVAVLGAGMWNVPGATITLTVAPKWIDQEVPLTLTSTATGVEPTLGVVPARLETVRVTGEKMMDTTGKKIVGEKAKGEVVVYNRTSLNKTLTKGTILTAPGGVKFSLDADVVVASKSAGADYVDVPGKATGKVTANSIGAESNLAGGTELTIDRFGKESYVAKNESALSGGTAEEVRVVAKEDPKRLASELTDELSDQLLAQVGREQIGEAVYLIGSSIKAESEQYSAKVGETASSVGLELTLTGVILRYQTEMVKELVSEKLAQAIPPGYTQAEVPIIVELAAEQVGDKNEQVSGVAKVKIPLVPVLAVDQITKSITGVKVPDLASVMTAQIPGLKKTKVTLRPSWLPPRLRALPRNPQKIQLELVAEES